MRVQDIVFVSKLKHRKLVKQVLASFAILVFFSLLMISESVYAAAVIDEPIEEPIPVTTISTTTIPIQVLPVDEAIVEVREDTAILIEKADRIIEGQKASTVLVHGTEYEVGDIATVFLQLVDNEGHPINDRTCFLDVYLPYGSANITHPEILNDQLFVFKEEGMYYYDMILPNVTGVYMLNAKCSYNHSAKYYGGFSQGADVAVQQGVFTGQSIYLNEFDDNLYVRFQGSAPAPSSTIANFTWNGVSVTNVSSIFLNVWAESVAPSTIFTVAAWNWTSGIFVTVGTVTFSGTAVTGDSGVTFTDEFFSFRFPSNFSSLVNGTGGVKLRLNTTGGSAGGDIWYNAVYLTTLSSEPTYLSVIRGSGEFHVIRRITELTDNFSFLKAAFWIGLIILILYILWRIFR